TNTPAERSEQIEQLYHAARERKPDERARFLERACVGDESLRQEVEALLVEDAGAENFLERPALEGMEADRNVFRDAEGGSLIGRNLGSYQILSFLGKGGMGEVYRAQDTNLRREVALKVLPEAFAQDPERLARFRREAQLLASLNHNNIGGIYEFEQSGNMDFLVLEMVPGETLG